MEFAALIVAAGRGTRAGGAVPKQYQRLGAMSVLERTCRAFLHAPGCTRVQVVINPEDRVLYDQAVTGLSDPRLAGPVSGGATRQDSVRAGLAALHDTEAALIHDAARPFVTSDLIGRVVEAIGPGQAALPALPIVDALWRVADGKISAPQDRQGLWRAQTPQGFLLSDILSAHQAVTGDAADDIAVAREAGLAARVVPGDGNNFKITTPEDFKRGERLLQHEIDIRTGNGFDVHGFVPGNGVLICGVEIPFDKTLSGHSDADVGMHAITDAIFGALAEGDIGQWFPPSDPQWKGTASHIFLGKAVERAAERGFRITHTDLTLICELPKIGPHAAAMRAEIARILRIDEDRVSVKATTSEKLGFTGRGEGIAAQATATLVKA